MSRFIQANKPKAKSEKERTLPKPGSYTGKHLEKAKPIYSAQGGKN